MADYSNAYSTMDKNYTESVGGFEKALDNNLVKKDYRVSPIVLDAYYFI
jgi:isoleucyl-tRNA synthetase